MSYCGVNAYDRASPTSILMKKLIPRPHLSLSAANWRPSRRLRVFRGRARIEFGFVSARLGWHSSILWQLHADPDYHPEQISRTRPES